MQAAMLLAVLDCSAACLQPLTAAAASAFEAHSAKGVKQQDLQHSHLSAAVTPPER